MSMRVTNRMLANNFLGDMRTNLANLQKIQSQLSTGKEISKPSDDPFKVSRSMQLSSQINANKQYNNNIKDTSNWLDATDTALNQLTNNLQRVRELVVSAGNAAYGSDERQAIKDELNQRIEEIAQVLNTNFDGKYLFGGTKVTSKPLGTKTDENGNTVIFQSGKNGTELFEGSTTEANVADQINMLSAKMSVEISQGVTMDYNVTTTDIFNFTNERGESVNLGAVLSNIVKNLDTDTPEAQKELTSTDLQGITDSISNLLKIRSEVGAKQNRMESAQEKNETENYNMTEVLSKTEDIDVTEKVMEFENKYNALVYHVIHTLTEFGELYHFLYVSDYDEEWEMDNDDIKDNYVMCYVWNKDIPEFSEFGTIAVRQKFGGIVRVG